VLAEQNHNHNGTHIIIDFARQAYVLGYLLGVKPVVVM